MVSDPWLLIVFAAAPVAIIRVSNRLTSAVRANARLDGEGVCEKEHGHKIVNQKPARWH